MRYRLIVEGNGLPSFFVRSARAGVASSRTGSPATTTEQGLAVKLALCDEDAAFPSERVWRSDTESSQYGSAITVQGLMVKEIHIAGFAGDDGERMSLLLDVSISLGACMHNDFVATEEMVASDIQRIGEKVYIAGRRWDLGLSSGGFVGKYSLNLVPDDLVIWADGDDNTGFSSLCMFPGGGLLAGGNCQSALAGSWTAPGLDVVVLDGTWSDFSAIVNVLVESTDSPDVDAVKITSGVVDTGGGDGWDALLSVVEFP